MYYIQTGKEKKGSIVEGVSVTSKNVAELDFGHIGRYWRDKLKRS
jgi:hypothetical protein